MSARTTRREARERIIKSFMDSLDRIIPPDESVPLRGKTFLDWERQADAIRQAVLPTLLQERAALDESARVGVDGCAIANVSDARELHVLHFQLDGGGAVVGVQRGFDGQVDAG